MQQISYVKNVCIRSFRQILSISHRGTELEGKEWKEIFLNSGFGVNRNTSSKNIFLDVFSQNFCGLGYFALTQFYFFRIMCLF